MIEKAAADFQEHICFKKSTSSRSVAVTFKLDSIVFPSGVVMVKVITLPSVNVGPAARRKAGNFGC